MNNKTYINYMNYKNYINYYQVQKIQSLSFYSITTIATTLNALITIKLYRKLSLQNSNFPFESILENTYSS